MRLPSIRVVTSQKKPLAENCDRSEKIVGSGGKVCPDNIRWGTLSRVYTETLGRPNRKGEIGSGIQQSRFISPPTMRDFSCRNYVHPF
jgi:hypothetical protein